MRVVLELAGIRNAFGKQLGSGNPLNNARAAIEGLPRAAHRAAGCRGARLHCRRAHGLPARRALHACMLTLMGMLLAASSICCLLLPFQHAQQ